jgi:hypothetical protein
MNRLAIERVAHEGIGCGRVADPTVRESVVEQIKFIHRLMSVAVLVDARAVRDLAIGVRTVGELVDGPEPKMPWPTVWADFAMSSDDRDAGAVLACQQSENEIRAYVIAAPHGHAPFLAGMTSWNDQVPLRCCKQADDPVLVCTPISEDQAHNNWVANIAVSQVAGFLYVLRLLQCRNAGTEPAPSLLQPVVPVRLGRRYGPAAGGYRMHTITIRVGQARKISLAAVAQQERDLPLHMVRGHFKHYPDDSPLLGKYAGWWWWAPHLRGSLRNGVVEKKYRIAPPLAGGCIEINTPSSVEVIHA